MAENESGGGNKLVVIILLIVLILTLGVIAFLLSPMGKKMMGGGEEHKKHEKKEEKQNLLDISFLPLPEMIINLKSAKGKTNVLKATFVLELKNPTDKEKIDHIKPMVVDQFQTYLRELELIDIEGASGLERIRQELFSRVNAILKNENIEIRNILFKDFLIQ